MREAATSTSLLPCHKHSQTLAVRHLKTAEHLKISKMEEDGNKRQIKRREKKVKGIWCSGCWRASQPMTCHQRSFVQSWPLVYPPMGSTAYEREISTPPMLLRSMALLQVKGAQVEISYALQLSLLNVPNYLVIMQCDKNTDLHTGTAQTNVLCTQFWENKTPKSGNANVPTLPTRTWPHLRCDVGLEERNIVL